MRSIGTLFISTQTKIIIACYIHNFFRKISIVDILFFECDNEVELGSDNTNQNRNSTTRSFFVATDQEFMQQF